MRLALRSVTILAVCLLLAGAAAAQNYTATINEAQETPPNGSPATGSATLFLDAAKILHVHVVFSGLLGSLTAAHIHCCAPPGTPAGVKYSLIPPAPLSSPIDLNVGPLLAADEANLNAGLMYVNIHSTLYTAGEIRGQILGPVGVESKTWALVKKLYE